MYVKEDLILPQTNTFYDFIVTKARGKSGPLFTFDVKEDIRLQHDASIGSIHIWRQMFLGYFWPTYLL